MPLLATMAKTSSTSCSRALRVLVVLLLCACVSLGSIVNLGDDDFDEFVGKLPDEALLLVDFFQVRRHQPQPACPVYVHCLIRIDM